MEKYLKAVLGAVAALAFTMETHATTIWKPTDVVATGDVNIILAFNLGISLNGGSLALFEDTAALVPGDELVIGPAGGRFLFTDIGGGSYNVEAFANDISTGSITMDGWEFKLAVDWGNGYGSDTGFTQAGADPNSHLIDFSDGETSGSALVIDLMPVPLPAAAWLFGSALLGLVAVGRRKA